MCNCYCLLRNTITLAVEIMTMRYSKYKKNGFWKYRVHHCNTPFAQFLLSRLKKKLFMACFCCSITNVYIIIVFSSVKYASGQSGFQGRSQTSSPHFPSLVSTVYVILSFDLTVDIWHSIRSALAQPAMSGNGRDKAGNQAIGRGNDAFQPTLLLTLIYRNEVGSAQVSFQVQQ
jgi:hypothetical protein